MIMEAYMSKICSVDQQAQDPGEWVVPIKSEGNLLDNFLLLMEASVFVLFKPSADWTRPTHIRRVFLVHSFEC